MDLRPLAKLPVSVLPEAARLRKVGDRQFSVIELAEVLAAEPPAFEEFRESVEKNCHVRQGSQAFRDLLVELRERTAVTIDQEALQDGANR